ncbi:MAG TPA: glycosyltransferase family 39 protein [Candidatus Binatia bacterium]|nr:glycosyltransferase family 39 protein [Candidatus Binatia bacterium]
MFTLFLLIGGGAALRFLFLARKPFWFDECFSAEIARMSWHDFIHLLWWREANMSLYYLLLRGWLHFGSSPAFIRGLSVLFSVAAIPAIFWLGRELYNARVGVLAAALLSCNAYHIRYAQEARSYALFVLLAILSSGFFVRLLRDPSRGNRSRHVITSTLAVYAHFYALLLIAAQWLAARAWPRESPSSRHIRRAWMAIGISASPILVFVAKTGAGPIRWISRPSVHDVLRFWEQLAGNDGIILLAALAAACAWALVPPRQSSPQEAPELRGWTSRFLLIWLLFPVVVLLLSLARPIFLGRYFIFCLPPLVLLAAAGLARLRPLWQAFALAAIMLLSLRGTFSYYGRDFDLERDASQASTNYILDLAQPGDAILFHIAEARVPYEFFAAQRTAKYLSPQIIFPRHGDRLDYRDMTGNPTADFVRDSAATYSRLWIVLMSNGPPGHRDPTTVMLDQVLPGVCGKVDGAYFEQVEVRLCSQRPKIVSRAFP